ncbi:MAG: undecaprenyl-diphosphate phosphatase [Planctomycetota bacterium]|nr:MAG: undecaprenyl-diphosphate phosphatase [Planctomycetota bacterium]
MSPLGILLILAVLQGLTEYLPVSSSGHVELAKAFLPGGDQLPEDASVVVLLHLGTLVSVLVFYHRQVWGLIRGFFGRGADAEENRQARRQVSLLAVATSPLFLAVLGKDWLEAHLFNNPVVPSVALLITGLLLWSTRKFPPREGTLVSLSFPAAFVIGLAQAFAITPGISRSGATIVAGQALGLGPQAAATFSFLLSIPAILGAGALKLPEALESTGGAYSGGDLALSFLTSAVVGCLALGLLLWIAKARKLAWFAPYCWILAVLGLGLSLR